MKLKIPSIPEDDDAKGIVVRVLSYEYYLKHFWLTFKDPYIEVEYQISTRRIRLKQTVYLSILTLLFGIYITIYPYTLYISDNPNKYRYTVICTVFGSINIFTSIIQIIIIYKKSINNLFNWPVLFIIKNSITFFIFYYLMVNDIFNIKYEPAISQIGNNIIKYLYTFDTEVGHTTTVLIITIFYLTIITINILNIKQFLVAILMHSCVGSFFLIQYKSIYDMEFKDLHNKFGWKIALWIIPGYNENFDKVMNIMRNNPTYKGCSELKKLYEKDYLLESAIKNDIYPYEVSIFNINKYYNSLVCTYLWLWLILIIFLFSIVYTREKGLRADFILRRVYSDIDRPRNMEAGIEIKTLINNNESKEDQKIVLENLKKWKKDSTSDSFDNQNFEIDVDLEEKETTVNDLELMELGSVLDGKTVKSFNSDSTFKRDKNDIIESVKKIVPKSYTKSEISNSINDTQSESHVQC